MCLHLSLPHFCAVKSGVCLWCVSIEMTLCTRAITMTKIAIWLIKQYASSARLCSLYTYGLDQHLVIRLPRPLPTGLTCPTGHRDYLHNPITSFRAYARTQTNIHKPFEPQQLEFSKTAGPHSKDLSAYLRVQCS